MYLILVGLFISQISGISEGLSFEEFITVNASQKVSLDALSSRLKNKLVHDYMKKDVYLLRFLRGEGINFFIDWRTRNNIDNVLKEEFPEYDAEYRVIWEGCDKGGNPVISLPVGDWDLRRVVIAGKSKRFVRYVKKILEEGTGFLRWGQEEGFNMTQATILFDLKGVNLVTHVCGGCIPMYLELLSFSQTYYSGFAHKIHVLYAPDFSLSIWDLYKNLLSSSISKLLEIHGTQKHIFAKELSRDIDPSQLTQRYGGKKLEGVDLSTMRAIGPPAFLANPFSLRLREKNITDFCGIDWPKIEKIIAEVEHNA
ncbi:SEC14 cytosolic factor [Folsomia candida]|uniref:SEC14 cytosolic factor n=1 Tax=Folsomia candida TaxID=158441 RepID=A0A226D2B5_FOLCA|nr:SEC14 cytosolic factor [Folsomia candida]